MVIPEGVDLQLGKVDGGFDTALFFDAAQMSAMVGKQGQRLTPVVTCDVVPDTRFSTLEVTMPGGTHSQPHRHVDSDIAVRVITGRAVTLVGDNLYGVMVHGPGEWIYIPAGMVHVAVNLSATEILTAIEVRTDPTGDGDTVVVDDLRERADRMAEYMRRVIV